MVQIIKSLHSFPRGIPSIRMKYPFWEDITPVYENGLNGVYRGDFIFFDYNSKVEEDKKINTNPLIIFAGIDKNGNILGVNLMFFNLFIDSKSNKREINRMLILNIIETMKAAHFDQVYQTGVRKAFIPFERKNIPKIFGPRYGKYMLKFWRVYNRTKISNAMNVNPDSALSLLSNNPPKYIKSMLDIK